MTKHENANTDQTQKLELGPQFKSQIVIKFKQQQDSKTKVATTLKTQIMIKLHSNCDKTCIIKLCRNFKTKMLIKLKT